MTPHILHSSGSIRIHSPQSPLRNLSLALCTTLASALSFFPPSIHAQPATAAHSTSKPSATGNAATVAAAQAFLNTLTEPQRQKTLFAFDNSSQRQKWSNLPSGIYQRAGLRLADLSSTQKEAAFNLLRAALSKDGFDKVHGILEGDEVVKNNSRGGNLIFGRDEYFISFLGQPSLQSPWLLQFGGHHLALNLTFSGQKGTLAPSHTAAQPARFDFEGKTLRPLGRETDIAFQLIQSLPGDVQKKAILGSKFRDLVLGPGHDGKTIAPEGVRVSEFNPAQRKLLLELAHQWIGIIHDQAAQPKLKEIESNLDQTWFAWSGPTTPGTAAYFRIQGPTVFIEYAPQNLGGDPTQHIHTMYRDPSNEYGAKDIKGH